MALYYAHGAIQWLAADAISTTYAVTCTDVTSGTTFQPKALRFTWCGLQSATDALGTTVNENRGVGFAKDTSTRRSVASFSQDNISATNCGTMARDDSIACTTDGSGADDGRLDLSSLDSGGFTAIVDNQPTNNITVFWEAWGGSDIDSTNVTIGDISEPAATGDQDYSATGFVPGAEDQVVMLAGVQDSNALNTGLAEASGFMMGYITGPDHEQIVLCGNADDGSVTSDTDVFGLSNQCLGLIIRAGAATVEARGIFTQFNAGGFRINWTARAVTSRKYVYLAIKGGSWRAGDLLLNSTAVNNTAKVSGLRFKPIGITFMSHFSQENASNAANSIDSLSWGCCSSTSSRRCWTTRDNNGANPSGIGLALEYGQILTELNATPALLCQIDISAMDVDGFTVITDMADAGAAIESVDWLSRIRRRARLSGRAPG